MSDLHKLLRPNIAALQPYSSARHEYEGAADVYLDANESPYSNGLNRYPDPHQVALKEKIASVFSVSGKHIFLGNGSDEALDLLIRCFCEPGKDSIITMPPTYGMYGVSAHVNNIAVHALPLTPHFELDQAAISERIDDPSVKLIFVCSPNNPTGTVIPHDELEWILSRQDKITVLDEAYIDFATNQMSIAKRIKQYPNLVILRTFSKAWGLAGVRLGIAFADSAIIDVLNKIKPPYNINSLTQNAVLKALQNPSEVQSNIKAIIRERERVHAQIKLLEYVAHVYPSEANFLLVKFNNAMRAFHILRKEGIIVRDRSKEVENCLRITIGTPDENDKLLSVLKSIE